jgi:hypothetical protein
MEKSVELNQTKIKKGELKSGQGQTQEPINEPIEP